MTLMVLEMMDLSAAGLIAEKYLGNFIWPTGKLVQKYFKSRFNIKLVIFRSYKMSSI